MQENIKNNILDHLTSIDPEDLSDFNIVLLPDFFVDHFLYFDDFNKSSDKLKQIYSQGGGNLPGIKQRIHQGGNAANTALALARLGVKPHLICRTDKFGVHLLKYFLEKEGVDISGVKSDGKLAITTAIEFGEKHSNVMVGDVGSVSDFSFTNLDDYDLNLISNSSFVCVLNWNLNRCGTDFAKNVFQFAKKHNVKTFFDSGDPSSRISEIPTLFDEVLTNINLDIFSLNENELRYFTNENVKIGEEAIDAAKLLKDKMYARLDLHTSDFSCSLDKKCITASTLKLKKIYRGTGAGDAWNAGNIFSELLNFDPLERLHFSNCFAAKYISSKEPIHPDLDDIISFILEQ